MSEKDLERIKNIYGKRNPKPHIEQRCQRLYTKQLDGLSTRQLVLQHAQREGIAEKTAWADWKRVTEWNSQDLERDRADILSRLHSMRQRLFNAALKKGQLQTAHMILDSLGRANGENQEALNVNMPPSLNIQIESRE